MTDIDIVDALRGFASDYDDPHALMRDAAAEIERLRGEGTRWYTAAYRAHNGNVIPVGIENILRSEPEHTVEEFRREDPEGPEYFVATRIQRPWERVPEGEIDA